MSQPKRKTVRDTKLKMKMNESATTGEETVFRNQIFSIKVGPPPPPQKNKATCNSFTTQIRMFYFNIMQYILYFIIGLISLESLDANA